ncbi:MAG: hypothetical protein JO337_13310 [Acidimicrobiales bacterium]|nr:hypothetical protein [Acidimicrobiales bacterium]
MYGEGEHAEYFATGWSDGGGADEHVSVGVCCKMSPWLPALWIHPLAELGK